jgi:HK97 gp10 family phage protein
MIKVRITKNLLPKLASKVKEGAIEVINSHAHSIAAAARQLAPVKTGELRDSIAVSESSLGAVRVVAGAPHAVYVELGTSRMSARPFLRPAVESDRPGLIRDLEKVIS